MRTLLFSVVLATAQVTDLRGRLDALKSDHIKMACPLGSLELNATEARLLARDATDVLTTTITHARDAVARMCDGCGEDVGGVSGQEFRLGGV